MFFDEIREMQGPGEAGAEMEDFGLEFIRLDGHRRILSRRGREQLPDSTGWRIPGNHSAP